MTVTNDPVVEQEMQDRPRPFGKLWVFLRYAFVASIIGDILLAVSNAYAFSWIKAVNDGAVYSMSEAEFIDLHQAILGGLYVIIYFACIVAYCRFYYRAMNNLKIVEAADLHISPFWTIGYFFVPFLSLWKPLVAVREIWRGSHDPANANVTVPAIIGWWWGFWLLGSLLDKVSWQMLLSSGALGEEMTNVERYLDSLMIDIGSALIAIIGAILVLRFSAQIKRAQEANILSSSVSPD
ncbi:DUF4328 domain-containing protein [Hyphococcus lacteus]|uniref:DUF4328 domain-containing protein n=1 Tax=Hyphococcus lacteus TaxID=3143536 RepID=A0ABV3Z6B1_9PROT